LLHYKIDQKKKREQMRTLASELLTVDLVAEALTVHRKTVLRFIREGRLRGTKVGNQYRVLRSDLNAFAGAPEAPRSTTARVTSIIDIDDIDIAFLQRVSTVLMGAVNGSERPATPVSLDVAHDPLRQRVKVVVVASPGDTSMLLKLVEACLDSAR
jgi:excisionase family DNA binding protein